MNHIEQGIADAHTDIEGLKATVGMQVTAGNGLSLASGVLAMATASASAAGAMSSADKAKLDKTSEVTASSFGSSSGYVKYGNGLIIQWGMSSFATQGGVDIYFPVSFSSIPYVVATPYNRARNSEDWYPDITDISTNYFTWYSRIPDDSTKKLRYIAIGK
jgi:hypothetical protein